MELPKCEIKIDEVKNYSDEASLLVKKWVAFLQLLNSET